MNEIVAPPARTLPALLDRQAELYGDKTLLRVGDERRTFAETRDFVSAQAGALAAAGITRGDRVASLSGNRLELLDLWLGCAWLGAVFVPINSALRGMQLEHVLANSGAKAIAVEPTLLEHLGREESRPPLVWEFDTTFPRRADPVQPAPVRPGDPAAILYTSGTTGPSKGVVCPHAQWYWWGISTARVLGVSSDDVLHTTLPLFHTNALNAFCQALVSGATYSVAPRFSASGFWGTASDVGATVTYLLGAMVSILMKQPASDRDRAHDVRVALAPATPAELHAPFLERFGVSLVDGWGSTETNVVLSNTIDDIRPGTIGRVVPGFEARVVDQDDAEVPVGTAGELVVRHSEPFSFATGYYGLPEKTVDAWRNLWFHTGDRVVRDADGSFRFVDRIKDVIRRRGENVSSHEVEQVLLSHPDVSAAAVFPVPAELGEDEVMACVVPRSGAVLEPLDLIRFCEPRIAYFAIPRYIEIVEQLPLTATGKVEKFRLRERGVTAAAWDRERAGYELRR